MDFPGADATGNADNDFSQYLAYASFSIAIWDHIITFDQEVEYFWLPKKGLCASCCFGCSNKC